MPLVQAIPRSQTDGTILTQFLDTTSTTAVTYTYPVPQTGLHVVNRGASDIFVSVGIYTNIRIAPNEKWKVDTNYSSFSIYSIVNSQMFLATARIVKFEDISVVANQLSTVSTKVDTVTAQLADIEQVKADKSVITTISTTISQKADKAYVETVAQSLASGSPKGVYPTLSALQTAFPTGNSNIYIISADGNWYYWNNNTWISGGVYQSTGLPDSVAYKAVNLMKNGNFVEGTTGWAANGGTASVVNNVYQVVGNGSISLLGTYNAVNFRYTGKAGHKIYARALVETDGTAQSFSLYASDGTNTSYVNGLVDSVISPTVNTKYEISGILNLSENMEGGSIRHFIVARFASANENNGKVMKIHNTLALDLTEIFGMGNEPSTVEMEDILSQFPNKYFDNVESLLNIKELVRNAASKNEVVSAVSAVNDSLEETKEEIYLPATNLNTNGDFSRGLSGWSIYGGSGSVSASTLSVTGNGTLGMVGMYNSVDNRYRVKKGHKIYIKTRVRVRNPNANSIRIYISDGITTKYLNGQLNTIVSPRQDLWYDVSGIVEIPQELDGKTVGNYILAGFSDAATANGKVIQIFRPLTIDLTEIFGVGSEPSVTTVDSILAKYSNNWFNGTSKTFLSVRDYLKHLTKYIKTNTDENTVSESYELYDDLTNSTWSAVNASTTSVTKVADKVLNGSQSLKITANTTANTQCAVDKTSVVNMDFTDKTRKIMIKVWVDKPSDIATMQFYIGNNESSWINYASMRFAGDGEGSATASGGMLRKGWNYLAVIPSEMTINGAFDWNLPMKKMRFTVTPKFSNVDATVIIDSIFYNGKGSPKIVITFDDAWKTVYENAFPKMRALGIKGTTYVIGQYVDNPNNPLSPDFCTLEELKTLRDAGWCLGNHTWQHNYYFGGSHTPESYVATIEQNKDWLIGRELGDGAYHVCYPNGEYDKGVIALLKAKGYKSARAAKSRGSHPEEIDQEFEIISRNFTYQVTLEQAKKWIDYAIESGGTTFLQLHQIPIDDSTSNGNENPYISWSKAKFEALMDYIAEKGIVDNCLTHSEWYEEIKNQLMK